MDKNNIDYESYGKRDYGKTQHQIIFYIGLITKVVFFDMKHCTPSQLERGNVFQKYFIEILKKHSTRLT